MDIIRGNLDGISRPASHSRIHPESRSSSASLEVLTPEPVSIKVDTSINLNGSSQQSNRENYNLRESSSIDDVSKIKESDLQLQEAVKKMKRLDKLLVEKQFKEKEIKKQGQEMRTKLWEELRTIKNADAVQSHEEIENTKKFMTLVPSSEETTDSFHLEQEEPFVSVFHTQIPPEEYENCIEQARQESVYQSESNKSLVKPEKKPQRDNFGELKGKKNQDFIKRNIELAKDSKSVVFMMDKEKRRLIELLKDIDDGEDILPSTEEIVLHDDTQVKVTPGDKALRNTKEQREEKNRLKEIDQQLRELEEDFMKTPQILSGEQLKTLLDKCILEQKSENESRDTDGIQAESIQPSISFISQLLNMSPDLNSPEVENDGILEKRECETPGYYLTKALGGQHHIEEFLVPETEEEGSSRPSGDVATSDIEDYFMSKTLGIGRLKRPSFLDDPLYCIGADSGPLSEDEHLKLIDCSTESPSKPDELTTEDKTEEEDRDS